ncbi:MAG: ATP-dependent metallopeptidase FtsH/Yme1/Tma family protein [Microcystis panniformis Mp_MB_F_20051200_S9]|uniref:ATP-dependent zinc metalloprotease FtsH n=1 Tax=Microcystis panniformis Mp_MB_F_20051200_S9 TaxID=2486223 RepID=A0A552Q6B5_9CHRO|nr:MAG: ATP-dependent metallopeptidase FtsH/Yme1/Tma family protein [Microcystis panniformis Mp_GB_SS_20050300_S99]TRV44822.1 MAG: ATP-dependent metallopeptidase FtsH/Yme1/Tma family protein [Microcystis panniformis Mp_GB_SS_20050300_S99D]TRV45268.1 MAG: ATP-dependent metallopeptidase FtsH/Yme1/Tma family protein [Microcystis panniformis Mp_MB_F_20080800_S26D]TRV54555.1 MAG: ATP-dependent metallopeptidase FtsH/Yme1/Tma family protein [Microcystis panniformis Mp_MB_F_20080800_S26]TRV61841.1 MAG:
MNKNGNNKKWRNAGLYALLLIVVLALASAFFDRQPAVQQTWKYSEFLQEVREGKVETVRLSADRQRAIVPTQDGTNVLVNLPNDPQLINILAENNVDISVLPQREEGVWVRALSSLFFPILLLVGLFFLLRRAQSGPGSQAMNFGKSKARVQMEPQTQVTFGDVAGIEGAKLELNEVVDFLKNADRFTAIGAKIPKGVLLVGPPGTGKTLLARAVAGEAGVPFFSISGSEFVEMFVGVGASRVRDLFEQAKANAPCIVFIDEIDAVGRQRGAGLGGGNDEREQTLNQLLTEMDGFEGNTGIIIIAATNRPDVLDAALLRPGRFDRQVVVDRPDYAGRKEILNVHSRGKTLAQDVDLDKIARRTPGFTGADLANLLNEAAILAARRNLTEISMDEINDAIDRVLAGPEKKNRVMSEKRKTLVAYHEAGHALVGALMPDYDPVQKISIIPRGRAGGLTWFTPSEDRMESGLYSRAYLQNQMAVALGGRLAEEIIFGEEEVTTGASNDLQQVARVARQMVTRFGMSDRLGPVALGRQNGNVFLGRDIASDRDFSDETAAAIDEEVRNLVEQAYRRAKEVLVNNRAILDQLAQMLVEKETVDAEELQNILAHNDVKMAALA